MRFVFASNGTVQTGGLVCGSVTLYAAYIASIHPPNKWTSKDVTEIIQKGSQGTSKGSVFDEDYTEAAAKLNLNVTDQYIADGTIEHMLARPIFIKSNQMMALTCANNSSIGHHMFITKYDGIWYWLESLPCDSLGQRSTTGTACLRIFSNDKEFEQFFVSTVATHNWSLRGISTAYSHIVFPAQPEDGACTTWTMYTLPDMKGRIENPFKIEKQDGKFVIVANVEIPKCTIFPLFDNRTPNKNTRDDRIQTGERGLFITPFFKQSTTPNAIKKKCSELSISTNLWSGYIILTTRNIQPHECITCDDS